jgi:hypothetical protein
VADNRSISLANTSFDAERQQLLSRIKNLEQVQHQQQHQ